MPYRVRANINGKRIETDITWASKMAAEVYAAETNKYRPGANARVVKVVGMKKVKSGKR